MSDSGFIGVFDSGVGGLSVWCEIARQLPHEDTLYLADQAHFPYGDRSLAEVRAFSESITRFLLDRRAKVVVIACNSASGAALHELRRRFPDVPFVGIEPAVKPAVEGTRSGIVGVLATPVTLHGDLFTDLLERYAGDVKVLTRVCSGLVEAIEAGALETPATEALLQECLTPLIEAGIDQLVLGCTHYPFLLPVIERVVGRGVTVIDPAPAVARQTVRLVKKHGMKAKVRNGCAPRHVFYTTGDAAAFTATLRRMLPSLGRAKARSVRWRDGRLVMP